MPILTSLHQSSSESDPLFKPVDFRPDQTEYFLVDEDGELSVRCEFQTRLCSGKPFPYRNETFSLATVLGAPEFDGKPVRRKLRDALVARNVWPGGALVDRAGLVLR